VNDTARIAELEAVLRDVLDHIRRQGNPGWQVNTCLVTDEQVTAWRAVLDGTPAAETQAV
jgi:hypothetical protein